MARKKKIESEKTREQIIDAAEMLFYEKGVSSTSLSDIASCAGVTRGAIYWHFKNKVDLFNAMHNRVTLPLEIMQTEALNQSDPLIALRDFWIRSILQIARDDRKRRVIEILFRKCEYVKEFEDAALRLKNWSFFVLMIITNVFNDAKNKNILIDNVEPNVAAISIYNVIIGILHSQLSMHSTDKIINDVPKILFIVFDFFHRKNQK